MRQLVYPFFLACLVMTACRPSKPVIAIPKTKIIQFQEVEPEVILSQSLKNYIKTNKSPRVVLRVPLETKGVTTEDINSNIYNIIEKELMKNGFIVKDRALFNEVLTKSGENTDYSKLKGFTETDIIIEIIKKKEPILFQTNKYKNENGESIIFANNHIVTRYGASVEFKIILLSNNEYAGSVTFVFSPCVNGCTYEAPNRTEKNYKQPKVGDGYEVFDPTVTENEAFYQMSANKLINILKGDFAPSNENINNVVIDRNIPIEENAPSRQIVASNQKKRIYNTLFTQKVVNRIPASSKFIIEKNQSSQKLEPAFKSALKARGFGLISDNNLIAEYQIEFYIGSFPKSGRDIEVLQIVVRNLRTGSIVSEVSQQIQNTSDAIKKINSFIKNI